LSRSAGIGRGSAQAQGSFPNKPIHIIVGFAAGGGNDIIVRVVAPKMSEGLDSRSSSRTSPVRRASSPPNTSQVRPDGYTLFMGPIGAMTMIGRSTRNALLASGISRRSR